MSQHPQQQTATTMENSIASTTIVQLNNCALTYFLGRDYEKSIALLRWAYEVFDVHSRRPDLNHSMCIESSSSSNTSVPQCKEYAQPQYLLQEKEDPRRVALADFQMDSMIVEKMALRSSRVEPTCNFASSPGTAYSMYNRALVFSENENDFSLLVTYKHRTAAIILYNLALVHHTIGTQLGVSAALPHAIHLYEMALDAILVGSSASLLSSPSQLLDVQKLLLALLNNLGNVYSHLYDSSNAQRCFQHLRVVLAACGPVFPGVDEDYTFFLLNAVFQGKELCFAPAA